MAYRYTLPTRYRRFDPEPRGPRRVVLTDPEREILNVIHTRRAIRLDDLERELSWLHDGIVSAEVKDMERRELISCGRSGYQLAESGAMSLGVEWSKSETERGGSSR